MATTYEILEYTIWLTDAQVVAELQAARARVDQGDGTLAELNPSRITDPGALYMAPADAAALYGATIFGPTILNIPPSITSPWIASAVNNANYPLDEATFERQSGGWFGIHLLFGDTKKYRWRGSFAYKPTEVEFPDGGGTPSAMPPRRWIEGFETVGAGSTDSSTGWARDASRHQGEMGIKGISSSSSTAKTRTLPVTTDVSWERFYIRNRARSDAAISIWRANTSSTTGGPELQMLPTGQLNLGHRVSSTFSTLGTTVAIPLDEWVKIDIRLKVGDGSSLGLYVNGALQVEIAGWPNPTGQAGANHLSSSLGTHSPAGPLVLEFDDWINAEPSDFDSLDWMNGTKIVQLHATGYGPDDTAAAVGISPRLGDKRHWQSTNQESWALGASEVLAVRFDTDPIVADRGAIGPVSLRAVSAATRDGGNSADTFELGVSYAGGAIEWSSPITYPTSAGTYARADVTVNLPSQVLPEQVIEPLQIAFRPNADADAVIQALGAQVELVGIWGPEDISAQSVADPQDVAVLGNTGQHVSPYPASAWARKGPPPISPVGVVSGTFTGNGTLTTLTFTFPVTWFFARNLSSANMGAIWWSSQNAAHPGVAERMVELGMIRARLVGLNPAAENDQETACEVDIVGNNAHVNLSGADYWYVAFCDPGMRFTLNAALASNRPVTAGAAITRLVNPNFLPEFALGYTLESYANTNTSGAFAKGTGHGGSAVTEIGGGLEAAGLAFAAGQLVMGSGWYGLESGSAVGSAPVSLWRRDDGSGDPGIPRVMQLLAWVGDGAASRTINMPVPSGVRPLWAMVVPGSNAAVLYRDPQNTGTTSYSSGGNTYTAVASTGITAGGIDQITVGSLGNANGIAYSALVFMGSETEGNNGWSVDGEFIPVEPAAPPDWPFGTEPPLVPDPSDPDFPDWIGDDDDGGGGTDPGVEPPGDDFGEQCVPASTKVCQQALAHIGVTVPIVDVTSDTSVEAYLCRLHYSDAVAEALREFPWGFATRYATLPRVSGSETTPYSGDWTYAYRMPTDLLFARRLVRPELGRRYDPCPPPFRQTGSDSVGRLLTANYRLPETEDATAAVELEYTYRPNCAAGQGDSLFRQALTWLVASKLAPGLARNKITAAECYQMFRLCGSRAQTVNANEQQPDLGGDDAPWHRAR